MTPFFAALLAALVLATPPAFVAWLRTWKPSHARRLLAQGALLLDVGDREEYADGHLDGALNIPSEELGPRQAELGDRGRPIVTYARSHFRSARAAQALRGIGFQDVFNIGTLRGVNGWSAGTIAKKVGVT
jgi:rhodanese-related sulfurtransferase